MKKSDQKFDISKQESNEQHTEFLNLPQNIMTEEQLVPTVNCHWTTDNWTTGGMKE